MVLFKSCLKLLKQYRMIEQMCSDAHSITLSQIVPLRLIWELFNSGVVVSLCYVSWTVCFKPLVNILIPQLITEGCMRKKSLLFYTIFLFSIFYVKSLLLMSCLVWEWNIDYKKILYMLPREMFKVCPCK